MRAAVAKETKTEEYRVALTPDGTRELVARGHQVSVERGAGVGSGFTDDDYVAAGAELASTESAWGAADLLLKVKEPTPAEFDLLSEQVALFTYLHLAADEALTRALLDHRTTAFAYETVTDDAGGLPLLAPMSEIAGKLAAQAIAGLLECPRGGLGILVGGVAGTPPAEVVVIGAGSVGYNAALVAAGLGAHVLLFDRAVSRLRALQGLLPANVELRTASGSAVERAVGEAHAVIGAVLVAGARAPQVVARRTVEQMRDGAVMSDVSIDQGGCFETSRPTTHAEPTYVVDGVIHHCVTNLPGAVPVTSTQALTDATLAFVLRLADLGPAGAVAADPGLAAGLSTIDGRLVNAAVAEAHGLPHSEYMERAA